MSMVHRDGVAQNGVLSLEQGGVSISAWSSQCMGHWCIYSRSKKNSDASTPSRSDGIETAIPHAQEWKQDGGGDVTENAVDYSNRS